MRLWKSTKSKMKETKMKKYIQHIIFQLKRLLRTPGFLAPAIIFPAMFYSFFGANMVPEGVYSQYSVASFCIYGVLSIAFYQFGVGIAQDRESAFDIWLKTLPASTIAKGIAQIISAMIFSLLAVGLVLLASIFLAKTQLNSEMVIRLLIICAIVAIPASLMGVALGYFSNSRAAPALANLIFLPLAFLGGLWIPPIGLPKIVDEISIWTPTRQMAELGWSAINGQMADNRTLMMFAGYTILFALIAFLLILRDRQRRFA